MTELLLYLFSGVQKSALGLWLFLSANAITMILFVLFLLLSLIKCNFCLLKRLPFAFFSLAAVIFEGVIECFLGLDIWATASFALLLIYCAIIFSIGVKTNKPTERQLEFAKYLSDKAKEQQERDDLCAPTDKPCESKVKSVMPEVITASKQKENKAQDDLDFSHVKSVLSRLEYYSLTPADKRLMKELESSLLTAERQEITPKLKEKINDGLGALLKIMSKYGI